uniref:Uncharacterized protein n=1 Tax=Rhizophora mucronata TaxID=61149 RepID=A0A2P2MEN3_RHIMU
MTSITRLFKPFSQTLMVYSITSVLTTKERFVCCSFSLTSAFCTYLCFGLHFSNNLQCFLLPHITSQILFSYLKCEKASGSSCNDSLPYTRLLHILK